MRALAWLVSALALGCAQLDAVDHVHDLRLLGIRADPPDQGVEVNSDRTLASVLQPVTVTALVADPHGGGRAVRYTLSVCAALDTGAGSGPTAALRSPLTSAPGAAGSQRCLAADQSVFATGSVVATAGWAEITGTFTASVALLTAALEQDPTYGIDGLRLPVQVELAAGDESVVGVKRVVFGLAADGVAAYAANANPEVTGIALAGAAWDAASPPSLHAGAPPDARGWQVVPQFDPALAAAYTQLSFTGLPLSFQEHWRFDYFADVGGFSPTTAGGRGIAANQQESTASFWRPPAATRGPATVWVVVRDGRGGEAWLVRQALFDP